MDPEAKPAVPVERVIALKRYEQPPPGYFHLLPNRILHRIEQGEGQSGFWEKWRPDFNFRLALGYALGLTVCGALTAGIFYSPKMDQVAGAIESPPGDRWAADASSSLVTGDTPLGGSEWLGSTNPVTAPQTGDSLFLTPEPRAIPVSLFQQN
jgi:hypothetical protein